MNLFIKFVTDGSVSFENNKKNMTIPIIVNVDKDIPLKKYKYLVNINIPFLEFCKILRSSIKLNKEEGLTYII